MTNAVRIDALSAIEHILCFHPNRIHKLSIPKDDKNARLRSIRSEATAKKVCVISSDTFYAEMLPFIYCSLDEIIIKAQGKKNNLVVALDHLQDPQNFGAICRSADAFGVSAILVPKDRCVPVTHGVYQASVGTIETVPICRVVNLAEALRKLKQNGFWIVGTSVVEGATDPSKVPQFENKVLVMGAEADGLSALLLKQCDWLITIPMQGNVKSLNVSVATGILLYHFQQQTPLNR